MTTPRALRAKGMNAKTRTRLRRLLNLRDDDPVALTMILTSLGSNDCVWSLRAAEPNPIAVAWSITTGSLGLITADAGWSAGSGFWRWVDDRIWHADLARRWDDRDMLSDIAMIAANEARMRVGEEEVCRLIVEQLGGEGG